MKKTASWLVVAGALGIAQVASAGGLHRRCRRVCKPLVKSCAASLPLGKACLGHGHICLRFDSCARERRTLLERCHAGGPDYCRADWGPTLNHCNRAWAEDHRDEPEVAVRLYLDIAVPDLSGDIVLLGGFSPECIRVTAGTRVTFTAEYNGAGTDFSQCPLTGGVVGTRDQASPFATPAGGSGTTFTFADAGHFPYYCPNGVDLAGAVIVEP